MCGGQKRESALEKWRSDWLNERDWAAVRSKLFAVAGVHPGLAARGWERATGMVLLALAGSRCLSWLACHPYPSIKRRVLASVSVATLLIAQNNPWLSGLCLLIPTLAPGITWKASKLATSVSQSRQAPVERKKKKKSARCFLTAKSLVSSVQMYLSFCFSSHLCLLASQGHSLRVIMVLV